MNVRMRPSRWAGLFLVFACSCAPLGQPVERRTPPGKLAPDRSADDDKRAGAPAAAGEDVVLERARAIAHRYIIVDGHVDLPLRLHASRDAQGTITEDITQLTARGCFDWPRARQGGLSAPFMSIYIPVSYQDNGAKRVADSLIDIVEGLVARAPDKFALARAPADVERNFGLGRMSLPMGMENGAGLEGRLENLEHFYRRGIRYITLAHAKDNDICDSASDGRHTHHGLSEFGRKVVVEMNRLGIMIDVAHVSDETFEQALSLSRVPIIASHTACRHFTPGWQRNQSDDMIRRLAERGGIVMISFGSWFLDNEVRRAHDEFVQAVEKYVQEHGLKPRSPEEKAFRTAYRAAHPLKAIDVEKVADHIDHAVAIAGVEHVGLGSDFEGVSEWLPTNLRDASQLPNLIRSLLIRGYTEGQIAAILSGNLLRTWRAVEAGAGGR